MFWTIGPISRIQKNTSPKKSLSSDHWYKQCFPHFQMDVEVLCKRQAQILFLASAGGQT
jgi:hypothetical protein